MEYTLAQKAYEINFGEIYEGYLYAEEICYAESLNKAKSLLFKRMQDNYLTLRNGEDATYLTIPVIRCKEADKFFFEDKELTQFQIQRIIEERERTAKLDEILIDDSIQYCYIKKGCVLRP